MSRGAPWVLILVSLAVIATGIGVAYAKYLSRRYFVELQAVRTERDRVDVEWGRLQLEVGTLATHSRVEKKARKRLKMHIPESDEVVILQY